MSTIGALNSGIAGLQKGFNDAQHSASQIASTAALESPEPTATAQSLIELKQAELQVAVSTEVIKTTDEVIGSLFDTFV
ncbi:MAG: hypothetical protein FD130_1809 [Halothiobacillaceae bacterium]|nr:MAG: hypothetical protein FD130_1809 [Halothiobacillaceae bacterium]